MDKNKFIKNEYSLDYALQSKKAEVRAISDLICEEFCYGSALNVFQFPDLPSKIFGVQNFNYILSGVKNKPRPLHGEK